jgi:hypothetical protein
MDSENSITLSSSKNVTTGQRPELGQSLQSTFLWWTLNRQCHGYGGQAFGFSLRSLRFSPDCGFRGVWSGNETAISLNLFGFPLRIITPPVLHTRLSPPPEAWNCSGQADMKLGGCILTPALGLFQKRFFLCLTNSALRPEDVWGSRGIAQPFLTSALDWGQWSASHLFRFNTGKTAPGTHLTRGWVGPRADLDAVLKRNTYLLHLPGITPAVQPVARCYTNWAIPAHTWLQTKEEKFLLINFNIILLSTCTTVKAYTEV